MDYSSVDIANRIKKILDTKNISASNMLSVLKLNKNALYTMQSGGNMPRSDALAKIADYLDCSVDYLLGRPEQKKEAPLKAGLNEELTWNEALIVGTYRQLPPKLQSVAMYLIDSLANAAENNIDILNYSAKDSAAG